MAKEESSGEASQEGKPDANADIYENRGPKKLIRLVTVMAYMFSVSFMAILLSAYYIFLWEPPNPRLIHRTHLQADPQVEFLISDFPSLSNHSRDHFDDYSRGNIFKEIITERKSLNDTQPSIIGRIADDGYDLNNSVDRANFMSSKNRRKLHESLFVLRNSLVELLRGKLNNSTEHPTINEERGNNETKESKETRGNFERETKNASRDEAWRTKDSSSNNENSTVSNGTAFLTLESSTISGGEANKDDFTSGRNASSRGSLRSQVDTNATKFVDVRTEEKNDRVLKNNRKKTVERYGKEESAKDDDSAERSLRNSTIIEKLRRWNAKSLDETGKDNNGTAEKGSSTVHDTTMDGKEAEVGKTTGDRGSFVDYFRTFIDRRSEDSSVEQTNTAMNSEETQIEKMTTKSTIAGNESHRGSETATTQRRKDMLTILTETTSLDKVSTTTSPSMVSEDFRTDLSPGKNHTERTV